MTNNFINKDMFVLIKKQIRPSLEIKFFDEINPNLYEIQKYVKTNYIDTGKLVGNQQVFNNNGLERVQTIQFKSYEDFRDFMNDKFFEDILFLPQLTYDIKHEISVDYQHIFGNEL
jgi:hypothetical protein